MTKAHAMTDTPRVTDDRLVVIEYAHVNSDCGVLDVIADLRDARATIAKQTREIERQWLEILRWSESRDIFVAKSQAAEAALATDNARIAKLEAVAKRARLLLEHIKRIAFRDAAQMRLDERNPFVDELIVSLNALAAPQEDKPHD